MTYSPMHNNTLRSSGYPAGAGGFAEGEWRQ